jgi:hypothetical protein
VIDDVRRIFGPRLYGVQNGFFAGIRVKLTLTRFTHYRLYSRSGLGVYMGDEAAMKAFILDNQKYNIYKIFVRYLLEFLVLRGFLQSHIYRDSIQYG